MWKHIAMQWLVAYILEHLLVLLLLGVLFWFDFIQPRIIFHLMQSLSSIMNLFYSTRVFTVFSTSKDHRQGTAAMAGCILVDFDKIQVCDRRWFVPLRMSLGSFLNKSGVGWGGVMVAYDIPTILMFRARCHDSLLLVPMNHFTPLVRNMSTHLVESTWLHWCYCLHHQLNSGRET